MAKNREVDRWVTIRVDELASAPALKPSSTARRDANRKTATATLSTVSAVRRLLRRALFTTKERNFISLVEPQRAQRAQRNTQPFFVIVLLVVPLRGHHTRACLFDERAFFQLQHPACPLGGVRIVGDQDNRLLEIGIQPLQQGQDLAGRPGVEVAGR